MGQGGAGTGAGARPAGGGGGGGICNSCGSHLLANKVPDLVEVDDGAVILVLVQVEIPHANLQPDSRCISAREISHHILQHNSRVQLTLAGWNRGQGLALLQQKHMQQQPQVHPSLTCNQVICMDMTVSHDRQVISAKSCIYHMTMSVFSRQASEPG